MTSHGYIIMIIVDSCIIWFHLDCLMKFKKSYYIATNVSSRKSATTFGDLPDWFVYDVDIVISVPYHEVADNMALFLFDSWRIQ